MALKPCKECKKEVSTSAKTCPHCGVKNPGVSTKDSLIGLGVLVLIVVVVVASCGDSDKEKQAKAEAAAQKKAECRKDMACIGNELSISAAGACQRAVESLANYSVKWTDGALEPKFSRFRWQNRELGIVTLLGDKVQFQNGYGAFANVYYRCDVEIDSRKVVHAEAHEGRL